MTNVAVEGPEILAAGGVVTRRKGNTRQFLVVHRPRYDDWSLPKGKLESGEKFSRAAAREIEEETGSRVKRIARLGSVAYNSQKTNAKLVRYWLFEHDSGKFSPNAEVDEVRWLPAADASALLTYPRDRKVFEWGAKLADSPRAGRIHLVRHAEAGSRKEWRKTKKKKKDALRPLVPLGWQQAELLAHSLSATPVGRLYSSRYKRCVQTLEPLASSILERIRTEPALAEGASVDDLTDAFGRLEGRVAVMSSHGAEIANLLEKLLASGAHLEPRPTDLPDKGGTWELELTAGIVTAGTYVPPPVAPPAD